MQFSDFQTQLNLMLGDVNNFALSSDEKKQNLTQAFNDGYAVQQAEDSSITFSVSTANYTVPTGIDVIDDIKIIFAPDENPRAISQDLWKQFNGNIEFTERAQWKIPDQSVLYLKGKHKVTVSDTVNDVALQNYILALAGWISLRNISYTKLLSFVRNNSTVQDMMLMRREMRGDVMEYRAQLGTAFVPN